MIWLPLGGLTSILMEKIIAFLYELPHKEAVTTGSDQNLCEKCIL